jgi:hypothetical protein
MNIRCTSATLWSTAFLLIKPSNNNLYKEKIKDFFHLALRTETFLFCLQLNALGVVSRHFFACIS